MKTSALNENAHLKAAAACSGSGRFTRLDSGGWCLRPDANSNTGIEGHHPAKSEVVQALDALLKGNGEAPRFTLGDFGAGIGQYGHALKHLDARHAYRAFDGAGNVENVTHKFVKFADLTQPVTLPRSDFVLSLEVASRRSNACHDSHTRELLLLMSDCLSPSYNRLASMCHIHPRPPSCAIWTRTIAAA